MEHWTDRSKVALTCELHRGLNLQALLYLFTDVGAETVNKCHLIKELKFPLLQPPTRESFMRKGSNGTADTSGLLCLWHETAWWIRLWKDCLRRTIMVIMRLMNIEQCQKRQADRARWYQYIVRQQTMNVPVRIVWFQIRLESIQSIQSRPGNGFHVSSILLNHVLLRHHQSYRILLRQILLNRGHSKDPYTLIILVNPSSMRDCSDSGKMVSAIVD